VTETILIIAISVIAAVVVGSGVFFIWTFVERLFSRPRTTETTDVTGNEEPGQTEADELKQDA